MRYNKKINNTNTTLKALYTNTDNSLLSKLDEIKGEISTEKYDLICITEIKPKAGNIPDKDLLKLTGYDLHVNTAYTDLDTRGVAIYTKQSLESTLITNDTTSKFKDSLWLQVPGPRNENLLVGCIYRSGSPAKAVQLDDDLHKMMIHMSTEANYKNVLMVGDFNHPQITWTPAPVLAGNHNENHPDVKFIDAINDSMLHQHVQHATRDRENQNSTLDDLILTSDPELVSDVEHLGHIGASDHQCLKFDVNFQHTKVKPAQTKRYLYPKADFTKMKNLLDINWDAELEGKSADEKYNFFLQKYNTACQESIPTVTVKSSDKWEKPIWMKPATLRLIQRKHSKHTKYLNTKNKDDKTNYNKIRNEVTSKTRSDRLAFERNISKEIKNNNKVFWRYVNANRSTKATIPDLLKKDGTKATTDEEKAEVLNEQFSSVFTKEDTDNLPEHDVLDIQSTLTDLNISEEDLKKKLSKLRTDKSPGLDGVHPFVLKNLAATLSKPLLSIFNTSLQTGKVPSIWKQGVVTAIFKKGNKNLAANYRAITLTSIVCKLLEDYITDSFRKHLTSNNKHDPGQHGFTPKKSTVTNLIEALNIWSEALSHGLPVDIIYLDYEKAFDKVPHERLLSQLYRFGIRGNLLLWIKDYLHERTQKVRVNGSCSSTAPVLSGVPQGSVLGPALFLIFVADASTMIRNFISLYADDTKLFSYIMEANAANIHTSASLQEDLNILAVWCDQMQMSYNIDKCHSLHLGNHNLKPIYTLPKMSNYKKTSGGISYTYNFHKLQQVQEEKDLGVVVDDKLLFRKHISGKISKANSMIFLIKHTFKYLDAEMFNLIYKALVRPQVEYASTVWSPILKMDINSLEKVQRRATKLVPEISTLSYPERLQYLKLPTLQYRRLRQDLIFIFKHTNQLINLNTRTYCKTCKHNPDMLTPSLSQTTRGHPHKYQIHHHQGIRNRFLTSRALSTWNNLNPSTLNTKIVNVFKNKLGSDLSFQKLKYATS